ncbi:MAG: crossover junction endodeoxyribonuclease RuvC [Eubacteriales bacterium]|nr:crossover junction endodeoxyribonuclease RuvC [Eubacteriales bacterium]
MRILGIDPGLATMGWGVVDSDGKRNQLVQCGAVITPPDMPMHERLHKIFLDVSCLCNTYAPDEIVFEELFFAKNVTTALNVGAARGCALCACSEYGKPMYEYTPMQIKQAVTGYGKADKLQVQQMVKMILNLPAIIRPDDAADAVAAALTHAAAGRMKDQFLMK